MRFLREEPFIFPAVCVPFSFPESGFLWVGWCMGAFLYNIRDCQYFFRFYFYFRP